MQMEGIFLPEEILSHISEYVPYGRHIYNTSEALRHVQRDIDRKRIEDIKKRYNGKYEHITEDNRWDDIRMMIHHIDEFNDLQRYLPWIAVDAAKANKLDIVYAIIRINTNILPVILGKPSMKVLELLAVEYDGPDMEELIHKIVSRGRYDLIRIILDRGIYIPEISYYTIAYGAIRIGSESMLKRVMPYIKDYRRILVYILEYVPEFCNYTDIEEDEEDRCAEYISMSIYVSGFLDIDTVAVLASSYNVLPLLEWALRKGSRVYYRIVDAAMLYNREAVQNLINSI